MSSPWICTMHVRWPRLTTIAMTQGKHAVASRRAEQIVRWVNAAGGGVVVADLYVDHAAPGGAHRTTRGEAAATSSPAMPTSIASAGYTPAPITGA